MNKLIKILHIDPTWKVIYILIRGGALVKTAVSLNTALMLMNKHKFDLILSEPQNIAILGSREPVDHETIKRLPFWKKGLKKPWALIDCPTGEC
jgi:hypothetical protein